MVKRATELNICTTRGRRFLIRSLSLLAVLPALLALQTTWAESSSPVCGDGLIEAGETCASCPQDCAVRPCTAGAPVRAVAVSFAAPPDSRVAAITVVLGYRSNRVSLPGSGAAQSVADRVKDTPASAIVAANDRDYELRVVVTRGDGIPPGRVFTVNFDACDGAAPVTAADFSCMVEGCASVFGNVGGCTCALTLP